MSEEIAKCYARRTTKGVEDKTTQRRNSRRVATSLGSYLGLRRQRSRCYTRDSKGTRTRDGGHESTLDCAEQV